LCRFLAFIGEPILLDHIMTGQAHSLVAQSMAAREAKTDVNADGCGLGWYGERADPGIYRSILPAWADPIKAVHGPRPLGNVGRRILHQLSPLQARHHDVHA
jgi:predicted glutamine amidotransferase